MKLLLGLALLLLPATASAHFLEKDGSIGAVLHLDPDDDPIIGQPASFYFDFKDRDGKFQLKSCACQVRVSEQGTQLYSEPLRQPSFGFSFPQADVYVIQVSGSPYQAGGFQPFTLTWNLRVDRQPSPATSSGFLQGHLAHAVLIGGGSILVIFLIARQPRRKR